MELIKLISVDLLDEFKMELATIWELTPRSSVKFSRLSHLNFLIANSGLLTDCS